MPTLDGTVASVQGDGLQGGKEEGREGGREGSERRWWDDGTYRRRFDGLDELKRVMRRKGGSDGEGGKEGGRE